jgi:hypothetical protein
MILAIAITALINISSKDDNVNSITSLIISVIEALFLPVSLIVAAAQFYEAQAIPSVSYITELNKAFVENEDYTQIYDMLQDCIDGNCRCGVKCCGDRNNMKKECQLEISKGQISNYLTFFETIYILKKDDEIDFKHLDDLFAYRFFMAVHSKVIQQRKLKTQHQNFRNIFCLEKEWLEYRNSKQTNSEGIHTNDVYTNFMLNKLVDADIYSELTEKS